MPAGFPVRIDAILEVTVRTVTRFAAFPVLGLGLPLAAGVATLAPRLPLEAQVVTVPDVPDRPEPPPLDPDKRLAVVLFGNGSTEITDSLAPIEVLGASGRFDVVALAPERRASPLVNGMIRDAGVDVLPHYGMDEYEAEIGRDPDLIVVPWLPEFETTDAEVTAWIRDHAGPDTVVVSICAGAKVVAATGLLDGRRATGTWGWIPALEEEFPAVRWDRDVRFVVDGPFVSSNTLTTGIDATLAAIELLEGRDAAAHAAEVSGYRHLGVLDDPSLDLVVGAGALLRGAWTFDRTELGFVLTDGVRDGAVAAALDTWSHSLADTTVAVGLDRTPIRTRYGLDLLPRTTIEDATRLDRIERMDVADGVFPYDAMLERIAAAEGADVAEATAGNVFYAGAGEPLAGPPHKADLWWKPLALGLLGLASAAGLARRW